MKDNSGKRKKLRERISVILLTVIFITGLAVMMYPTVSNYINSKHQSHSVEVYDNMMNQMDEEEYHYLLDKAEEYNKELFENGTSFGLDQDHKKYNSILNMNDAGVIGYITIPCIKRELPIYHGTDDSVLNVAAGHLEGSSFPVGGESTHAVISAHRGLPTSKLFTDLDKIETGDIFTVTVLNEVLTYEVDSIQIVEPNEIDNLRIKEGSDFVTLMTCTPYGVNTHRLLVRGQRVVSAQGKPVNRLRISSEAFQINPHHVAVAVSVPIIILLYIVSMTIGAVRNRKRKNKAVRSKTEADVHNEKP